MGDSHQSALHTLIHHILGSVHSGFEPELEFPEREPQKILWFWIWGRNPKRNAMFPSDFGNIFILEESKTFSETPKYFKVRPFIIQSDLSVENGLFRLKRNSGFLTQSKKGFFDSSFFD